MNPNKQQSAGPGDSPIQYSSKHGAAVGIGAADLGNAQTDILG